MVYQSTYAKVEFKPKKIISNRHFHNFFLKSNLFSYVFPDYRRHIEFHKPTNRSEN